MADYIINEITSVRTFVAARERVASSSATESLQKDLASALLQHIQAAPKFTMADAGRIASALSDNPYGEEHTRSIMDAVDRKLAVSTPIESDVDTKGQLMVNWQAYLTQGDWDFLRNSRRSWDSKMTKLVERSNALGLTAPSEQTIRWAIALLLLVSYDELPTYSEIFKKVNDLKQCFVSEKKRYPHEHLAVYPSSPAGLSGTMYDYAYADEPPVSVVLAGVKNIADNHVPLRSNSKLLSKKKAQPAVDRAEWVAAKQEADGNDTPTLKIDARDGRQGPSASLMLQPVKREETPMSSEGRPNVVLQPAKREEISISDEEEMLRTEFEDKLQELNRRRGSSSMRIQRDAVMAAPVKPEPAVKHEPSNDAASSLAPRRLSLQIGHNSITLGAPKHERADEPSDSGDHGDAHVDDGAAYDDGDIRGLDEYARAALQSLQSRNTKKKAEKKDETEVIKRPASDPVPPLSSLKLEKKAKTEPKHDLTGPLKRPAAAGVKTKMPKAEPVDASTGTILKLMPKRVSGTEKVSPIVYNGGIIYTSFAKRNFRALRTRGDNYSEHSAAWRSDQPTADAWRNVVTSINEARAAESAKRRKTSKGK